MQSRGTGLSEFGRFFLNLCEAAEVSPYAVALQSGIRTRSRVVYALRERHVGDRTTVFSIAELLSLAANIPATDDQRNHLVVLGVKEHATPDLRQYIAILEKDSRTLRKRLNMPELKVRLREPTADASGNDRSRS